METKARTPLLIRSAADYDTNKAAVTAKLVKNSKDGKMAFLTGAVKPFEGFSRTAFEHEFQARAELTDTTRAEIADRITRPLQEIAQKLDIKIIAAGFDFDPSHIILGTGKFSKNADPAEIDTQVQTLTSDWKFNKITEAMKGRILSLNGMVNSSNGSIYACARGVSEEMFRARTTIANLLGRTINISEAAYSSDKTTDKLPTHGFSLVDFKDITHSTVARIESTASAEQLSSFYRQTHQIARDLRAHPIQAEIADVYFGTSIKVMDKLAPQLITQA